MSLDRPTSNARISRARSFLFVPGNRADRFEKARASSADIIILDLEDAVPPSDKIAGRQAVAARLDPNWPVLVRVNAAGTLWHKEDCELIGLPGLLGIMLPKAEPGAGLAEIAAKAPLVALVESAVGVAGMQSIATTDGVIRLALGTIDLAFDLDVVAGDQAFDPIRLQLTIASRAADIAAPVDGVTTELRDVGVLSESTRRARSLGFGGKLCIHPAQIQPVHDAFMHSDAEIAWAQRVLDATARANGAAVAVDGRMVDRPVAERAKRLLIEAGVTP